MLRKSFVYLLFACLCSILPIGARSQSVNGVIAGTVTDPSGAEVPNVRVTIINTGTGISQTTTTGTQGEYRFALVPPGNYSVQFEANGFATEKATGVVVQASQTVPFSVKLRVATTKELIEVTGEAPLVQTETSDLTMQVDNTTIQNMALVDRDVFGTLPMLAPQAAPGMDNMITAGGARQSGTSYMLNGGEDNDNFSEGGINIHPPLESVQDFSLLTNNMSAEYGRGMGAVVSANQKSGTNKFHGVLYEFNRNASLNANDWFYNRQRDADPTTFAKKPKYIRNQFGGEADGPIYKDKTFFSGAYDRTKLSSGYTAAHTYVPTSAALSFLQASGEPLMQEVIGAYPPVTSDLACPGNPQWLDPNGNPVGPQTGAGINPYDGAPNSVGCLSFFNPQIDTIDTYYGRVDHNFSAKDRLSFNANIYRELFDDKNGGTYTGSVYALTSKGPIPATTTNHFHNLTLSEVHTAGTSIVNEATVAHNRHYNVFQEGNGTKDTIPSISIDNQNEGSLSYNLGGDAEGGQVQNFTQDRWAGQDNLSWNKGRHSMKFGGGTQYGILYRDWDLGLPGLYEFGELITLVNNTGCGVQSDGSFVPCTSPSGPPVTPATDPNGSTLQPDGTIANLVDETQADFAGDYPYYQETSVDPNTGAKANAYRHYVYHDWYWFIQDDWKATPRLTLNLGIRWDRYGAPSEVKGILAQLVNFNCNPLDPTCIANARVGPVSRMWPTQNHDFAPRIGFAFDPLGNHKMAIRGGFGIYYDRIFDNIWSNGAWNPPFYALLDFEADLGDAVFYSNPASIGAAYDPTGPCGPVPNAATDTCTGHRVSVRTMDQHMRDSSGQSFYLAVEREVPGNLLLHANYQGLLGRHLPMLENVNRVDGIAANSHLSPVRPNPLYTGFNFRSNSVTSNYHALVLQAQKRMSHGLQFDTGYTFSKLLDRNSELFAGCSLLSGSTAYYYTTNKNPSLEYGRGSFDHRHSFKFSAVYQLPFLRAQNGFAGHVLGGWNVGSLFQFYTGHPIDVFDGRTRYRARDASGALVRDPDGVPYNLGGDYNLDGVANERPIFVGSNLKKVYSGATPANGIFKDNNIIGCDAPWIPGNVANVGACDGRFGVATPNSLFQTPAYPGTSPTYERYGTLGRDVFVGPNFAQLDFSLGKSFKLTERAHLEIRGEAQNLANHPNFDNVTGNLGDSTFGQAQLLLPNGLGAAKSRVMSVGARVAF